MLRLRKRPRAESNDILQDYLPLTANCPFDICETAYAGKGAFAKQEITKGTDILCEVPLVAWPLRCSADWVDVQYCEECFQMGCPADTKGFCSEGCRLKAVEGGVPGGKGWMYFLDESCLKAVRGYSIGPSGLEDGAVVQGAINMEAIARVLAICAARAYRLASSPAAESLSPEEIVVLGCQPFERLIAPPTLDVQDIDAKLISSALRTLLGPRLEEVFGKETTALFLQEDAIKQLAGQLCLNAQSITVWGPSNSGELSVLCGAAVYSLQSCFNHSCLPNCTVACLNDNTLQVTAIREIQPTEELTIAYISTDLSLEHRRKTLSSYFFVCSCEKCCDEASRIALPNP